MKTGMWSRRVKLTVSTILPFACSTRVKKLEGKREDRRIFQWRRIYQPFRP